MLPDHIISTFIHGTHNLFSDEKIPDDAASDSSNWITQDGRLKLVGGRNRIGAEGVQGSSQGLHFGYKVDGTTVLWDKTSEGKIRYFNGTAWVDVVTDLSTTKDYVFSNYASNAGSFTYAFGPDGIYKFHNAVPGSYISLYDSTKNFKGYAFIDKGRSILWNKPTDKTGLYGSYIDRQDATVYTSVSGEATVSFGGTLAFKGGGATRNCFGVTITLTGTGEVYTDNYLGVLTGSLGGTGTINYISGAYTLSNAGVGTAAYQWEDSNAKGITDFTHSATRLAGEGFVERQDEGGDPIMSVLIGQDGAYYSMKTKSVYRFALDTSDTAPENIVYRRNIGIQSLRSAVSTNRGIVFINTAAQDHPVLTVLERNPLSNNVEPTPYFPHFKFANYLYDDACLQTTERYLAVLCKTLSATNNDTILLCDLTQGSVDATAYNARTAATDSGYLYVGSSLTRSVYKLYDGFDDDGLKIENYWIGGGSQLMPVAVRASSKIRLPRGLKKVSKLYLKGLIDANQSYEVYANYDEAGFQLVGTIRGDGPYVDYSNPQTVGSNAVGAAQVGGDQTTEVFPYFTELKLKNPKFRKRNLKFVALGIGYVDIETSVDHGITVFEDRLPKRFRQKQNVSLDGTRRDLDASQF